MKQNKIYDCFLFFQEFEILSLRLEYLYEHVDYFVIIESSQTFSGHQKDFQFEKKLELFQKFKDKIIYHQINIPISSFHSLKNFLEKRNDAASQIILQNMIDHNHYNKNELNWVIDTFQRESIKYPLFKKKPHDNDIILISDLDEIPSHEFLLHLEKSKSDFVTNKQFEFSYNLNVLSNSSWYGTIASKWKNIKNISFNSLRLDVKKNFKFVKDLNLKHGGYHFTTYGDINQIKRKIQNWSHQEFNNVIILYFLSKNIKNGLDIFGRSLKSQYRVIDLDNRNFFDDKMSMIIQKNKMMISQNIQNQIPIYYLFFFILAKFFRVLFFLKTFYASNKNK
jgi:beta-1,4-mannosyl-glycoprotein beta-1,4-N-acetylglucosaminyltransferase